MIFLATALFNEAERDFNKKVAGELRKNGFKVWMAQEAPFIHEGSWEEKKRIYEGDILALKESDVVLAVLDGVEIDAGVAFEVGYAKAIEKPIIGLKTDFRIFSRMEEINLMLEVSLVKICKSIDEVIATLKKM